MTKMHFQYAADTIKFWLTTGFYSELRRPRCQWVSGGYFTGADPNASYN